MRIFKSHIRLTLGICLLLSWGCKKDNDGTVPVITINTPNETQSFNVMDIITVSGSVSDES